MDIVAFIQKKIYDVRGEKVMLDIDLAILYQLEINIFCNTIEQNKQRFSQGAMFRLTKKEWDDLRPDIKAQPEADVYQPEADDQDIFLNTLPNAFTEHAISILGGIFNSSIVIKINIAIMQTLA